MEKRAFYHHRIEDLQQQLKKLQQKRSTFGVLRIGSIVAIIIAFYVLWSLGIWYVLIVSIALMVIFIRVLFADTFASAFSPGRRC